MAGQAALNTIGLISGVLGIASFTTGLLPEANPQGASIRIKAGVQCLDGCSGFDGTVYEVYGWNNLNEFLGSAGGSNIPSGGVGNYVLDQNNPGAQAAFTGVNVENDALCIQWVSVQQFDGIPEAGGFWNGDVGTSCGQTGYGYPGHDIAGTIDGQEWRPACMWLDGDGSNGILSQSLKFRTTAYGQQDAQATLDGGRACDSTLYSPDQRAISATPAKRAVDIPRKAWMERQLVVSPSFSGHNATEVCANQKMWGPDFVGSDGNFCDMGTREVIPLCSHHDVEGCLVIDQEEKSIKKRSSVAKRTVHTTHRQYRIIDNWG